MTLTAHSIVGAAIASALPQHPVLGFALAFASHFAVDAIPHYDYHIESTSIDPRFATALRLDATLFRDFLRIGSDAFLGFALSILFFGPTVATIAGIVGGMLPDFLQFAWMRIQHEPLNSLQRFHKWIHSKNRLEGRPLFGIFTQMAFLAAVIVVAQLYF